MKVLIIDADHSMVEALRLSLQLLWNNQAEVVSAADGERALEYFAREAPDIILLDINIPDRNGWDVLRCVRAVSDMPVIMLTARCDEVDKVRALELGADDYLTKPFSHLELFARIKAVLRRTERHGPSTGRPALVTGDLRIVFDSHEVTLADQPLQLTPTEYNLLCLLVRNAGRVVAAEWLLHKIWGPEYEGAAEHVKTYISRLRHKLHDDPTHPRYIVTEPGVGYRFVRPAPLR